MAIDSSFLLQFLIFSCLCKGMDVLLRFCRPNIASIRFGIWRFTEGFFHFYTYLTGGNFFNTSTSTSSKIFKPSVWRPLIFITRQNLWYSQSEEAAWPSAPCLAPLWVDRLRLKRPAAALRTWDSGTSWWALGSGLWCGPWVLSTYQLLQIRIQKNISICSVN